MKFIYSGKLGFRALIRTDQGHNVACMYDSEFNPDAEEHMAVILAAPDLLAASKPKLSDKARERIRETIEAERAVGDRDVAAAIEFLLDRHDAQQAVIILMDRRKAAS